jgi:hypothetical protein
MRECLEKPNRDRILWYNKKIKIMKGVLLVYMGLEGTTTGLILGTVILLFLIGYFQNDNPKKH